LHTAARRQCWKDFLADDASIIHDGQPVIAKAPRAFYQLIFANKDFNLTWSPTHAEASAVGNPGLYLRRVPGQAGDEISRGIYTTVCRKVDDDWKVVLDLGSIAHAQSKPQN